MASKTNNLSRLLQIVARLRGPGGCPWDIEQTHQSIRHNLIEECYEALEAIDSGDMDAFQDELGDLLMQIVFHAQMASEEGHFTFDDVAGSIADKLVRRHPHVFGENQLRTSDQVLKQWEEIKKKENNSNSVLNELPKCLPALLKADKIQRKVARVGFDWKSIDDVLKKMQEELSELKIAIAQKRKASIQEEIGDLLFSVVNLARHKQLQAEDLLNQSTNKFVSRFQQLEKEVLKTQKRFETCTPDELDKIWEKVKKKKAERRN